MGSVTYIKQAPERAPDFVSRLASSHGAQLQRFLLRMLGRRELAEEIAQDTYLKLHRLCKPEDVVCPQALLFDVATKLALTRLKKLRAETALVSPPPGPEPETDPFLAIADEAPRPDRRVALEEAMKRLAQVVEQLPPNLRQVFVMRYVRQLPRQEIAERLKLTVGAVEQRLTRALAYCRGKLEALGIDGLGLD